MQVKKDRTTAYRQTQRVPQEEDGRLLRNGYKKRYHLLIERSGSSNLEQLEIPSTKLKLGLLAGMVVLITLISLSVFGISEMRVQQRTKGLEAENRLLSEELLLVQSQVDSVIRKVDTIAEQEDALRVRVDLPPLEDEVREAGIGTLRPMEGKRVGDERVENLLSSLDQIERQLSIQRQSFDEIREKIVSNQEKLAYIPSVIPVQEGRLTDGFGYRRDPFTRQIRFHYGADFAAPQGTEVYATANGRVIKAHRVPGFGKVIELDHGYGYTTIYGHLDEFHVRRGDSVTRGQVIGRVGNTGRSTAPHLHYEVQVEGHPVDPLDYFYEGYQLYAGGR